jgi:myo-inositol-1(or 4)-monophosphatase
VLTCLQTRGGREAIGTGAGGDVTKRFDFVAEQTIVDYLAPRSSFTLISEEAGTQVIGANPKGYIIMDPIDGSTNISHGISFACIAVAFATKPRFDSIEVAVVQDLFSETAYHAMKGKGAKKNYHMVYPSPEKPLQSSLVGVDDEFPSMHSTSEKVGVSNNEVQFVRHFGANALELCFVADGSLDGFVDLRGVFRGTDLAAPTLILLESGASIIDEAGTPLTGACTNDEKYALIAARNDQFANQLLVLAHKIQKR